MIQAITKYAPEDLLRLPDDGKIYELVNGELVEKDIGWNSSWTGGRLGHFISSYLDGNPLGLVVPADAGYQCFADDPGKVRKPDASFIRADRLPPAEQREGHCRIAPDAAAKVVSPNDLYSEVEEKVIAYLAAGVKLVWVINPPTRSLRVHRCDGTVTDLDENDELSGENVLPGFRCKVADLFQPKSGPA